MGRNFTKQDDLYIVMYFDAVGSALVKDTGKSWSSIKRRAKLLKDMPERQLVEAV